MKKQLMGVLLGVLVLGTSCKKYLDINDNPNQAISATPKLVLPLALTATANMLNSYNLYGSETGIYAANAGGYGGFGELITYNYTSSFSSTLWDGTYDNLEDYQAILNAAAGEEKYLLYDGVARIMKAYDFQLLVDAFNNVPYKEALKGDNSLTPAYDNATDIYKDLALQLDTAIAKINAGLAGTGIEELGASDVVFAGDMVKWKKFANTLKLRIILRGGSKVQFANKTFSADGFLTTDAIVNPGYAQDNGKQNPIWDYWGFKYTGTTGNKAWMPSTYVFGYYDGHTLTDPMRGKVIYYKYPSTGINRLGFEGYGLTSSPSGSFWYASDTRSAVKDGVAGILKGPTAGVPMMLAAESYFLQAEAAVRSIISANGETLFYNGITASYQYLYQLPADLKSTKVSSGLNVADSVAKYKSTNSINSLVNYSLATTTEQKIESIITQKFIALNFINGQEGWNEYRRTRYPKVVASGNGYQTFASSVSESSRADKLPTRIMYPTTEGSYNSENIPTGITPFTSLIFWALQ